MNAWAHRHSPSSIAEHVAVRELPCNLRLAYLLLWRRSDGGVLDIDTVQSVLRGKQLPEDALEQLLEAGLLCTWPSDPYCYELVPPSLIESALLFAEMAAC